MHDSGRLECAETQSEEGGAVGKSLTGEVSSSLQRVSSSLWREGRLWCEGVVVFAVKGLSSLLWSDCALQTEHLVLGGRIREP